MWKSIIESDVIECKNTQKTFRYNWSTIHTIKLEVKVDLVNMENSRSHKTILVFKSTQKYPHGPFHSLAIYRNFNSIRWFTIIPSNHCLMTVDGLHFPSNISMIINKCKNFDTGDILQRYFLCKWNLNLLEQQAVGWAELFDVSNIFDVIDHHGWSFSFERNIEEVESRP